MHAAVEHLKQGLHRGEADAGEALCQSVGTQQHDRAGHILREGSADAAGIGYDQVILQLVQILLGDRHIDKFTEACA